MKSLFLVLYCGVIVLSGCGIFSPRDSEYPVPEIRTNSFNFDLLFDKNGSAKLRSLELPELFIDEFTYEDFNSGAATRDVCISFLQQLERKFTFNVNWIRGNIETDNDRLYLNSYHYSITDEDGVKLGSGRSDFILVDRSGWQILYWKDIPDGPQKSFFSPN